MNSLFELPETPLTALQAARLRMDAAQKAFDEAFRVEDGGGDPIPKGVKWEWNDALQALRHAEAAELRRLRE